jgi:hypothetical protein
MAGKVRMRERGVLQRCFEDTLLQLVLNRPGRANETEYRREQDESPEHVAVVSIDSLCSSSKQQECCA